MTAHIERLRVAWIDTDASGRIHFTAAFRWAELAEVALNREHGLLDGIWGEFPRRKVEAEFLLPLVFDDEIEIRLRVGRVGTTSVTYEWDVVRDGEVAIKGSHVVVRINGQGQPSPLDPRHRAALEAV